jgi:hypothetical protein
MLERLIDRILGRRKYQLVFYVPVSNTGVALPKGARMRLETDSRGTQWMVIRLKARNAVDAVARIKGMERSVPVSVLDYWTS